MSQGPPNAAAAAPPMRSPSPAQRPSQNPQRLQERGPNDTLVHNSPYGPTRNTTYGWGSLFKQPPSAVVPGHPNIHIGISSLNGVPTIGKSDRSMRSLLAQYRKKFSCLEHCYPYHKVGDDAAWRSWADMVRDSNAIKSEVSDALSASSSSSPLPPLGVGLDASAGHSNEAAPPRDACLVNAARFIFTVKANNLLTHVKPLQMHDVDVQEVVQTFFHQRCPLLEPFLGPVLVQLPPSFAYSAANVQRLTELHDGLTKEACELREVVDASSPDTPASVVLRRQRRVRVAVEFRNRTWYRQETFDLLRSFQWALVAAHHHDDPTFSNVVDTGAGFLYVRLHGPLGQHVGDYGSLAMQLWAEELVQYLYPGGATPHDDAASSAGAAPKEVFVFLNNSDSNVGGTTSSVVDATCLAEHLRRLLPAESRSTRPPRGEVPSTGEGVEAPSLGGNAVLDGVVPSEGVEATTAHAHDDVGAPSRKRARLSTQSGDTRDDEVVID